MKRFSYLKSGLLAAIALAATIPVRADEFSLPADYTRLNIFDKTVFYDGYKTDKIVDADAGDGIIRFSNSHYAYPVNVEEVLSLGDDLQLEVILGALCDNYDRMGRVMIAFPQSGSTSYDLETTDRIEIARFITPFMNKNKSPKEVPYIYEIDDFRQLLSDKSLLEGRDVWMEIEVFGVPYDAQKKIAGCADRNDVFSTTISFAAHKAGEEVAEKPSALRKLAGSQVILTPITVSKDEIKGLVNFNNYKEEATDTLGVTTKTYAFDVTADLSDAQINLILTNHGANENGEEYVRRQHLVYVDGEIVMAYTPGGVSCEPYRKYNTQRNLIYGDQPEDDWEEWSNWCPGQAVPIRRISLGEMKSGRHELMIRVPEAEFYGKDGDFRPSAYLQGVTSGKVATPSAVEGIQLEENGIEIIRDGKEIIVLSEKSIKELRVYSYDGRLLEGQYNPGERYNIAHLGGGQYIIVATAEEGASAFIKVII